MLKVRDREALAIKKISVINEKQKRREELTVGHPALTDTSAIQTPHLSQGHLRRGGTKVVRKSGSLL